MKKMLILSVLVVAMLALFVGTAFAGSWWVVNSNSNLPGEKDVPSWNTNSEGLTWALDAIEYGASANRSERFYYRNNGGTSGMGNRFAVTDATETANDRDSLSDGTPHGGYSTTTGYCKTCHAVHEGGSDSYRLLKSGSATDHEVTSPQFGGDSGVVEGADRTSGEGAVSPYSSGQAGVEAADGFGTARSNECMYCHDADAGYAPIRPYALSVITIVRGEHTVGATHIPDRGDDLTPENEFEMKDRDPNDAETTANGVLQCYQCHSVHGSRTIGTTSAGYGHWAAKILRLDPNGDGTELAQDLHDNNGEVPTQGDKDNRVGGAVLKNQFCTDCHRANSNWSETSDFRTNSRSHPQGPSADGTLEVYGEDTKVAWTDYKLDGIDANTATSGAIKTSDHAVSADGGCRGCHSADDNGNEQKHKAGLQSTWPHQSIGPKLLNDTLGLMNVYGDDIVRSEENNPEGNDAGVVGDADRQLINMDAVCLRCHRDGVSKTGSNADDTHGVGLTF